LVAAAKFLVAATKKKFVVPDFVAVTKSFFFRERREVPKHETFLLAANPRRLAGAAETA